MELTEKNLDRFLEALRKRLRNEMKADVPVVWNTHDHFPEPRLVTIGGETFPYPAIGETISIQIGFRTEELSLEGLP